MFNAPEPKPVFLLLEELQGLLELPHGAIKRGSKEIDRENPALACKLRPYANTVLSILVYFNRALIFIAMIYFGRHSAPHLGPSVAIVFSEPAPEIELSRFSVKKRCTVREERTDVCIPAADQEPSSGKPDLGPLAKGWNTGRNMLAQGKAESKPPPGLDNRLN